MESLLATTPNEGSLYLPWINADKRNPSRIVIPSKARNLLFAARARVPPKPQSMKGKGTAAATPESRPSPKILSSPLT